MFLPEAVKGGGTWQGEGVGIPSPVFHRASCHLSITKVFFLTEKIISIAVLLVSV